VRGGGRESQNRKRGGGGWGVGRRTTGRSNKGIVRRGGGVGGLEGE